MTEQSLATTIESSVIMGDLSKLTPEQRVNHYLAVCKSCGLNPLTKPFDYLNLSGKLVLYARKDATDQLRRNNLVSILKLERETVNGVYVVTAYAQDGAGRTDSSIGAVNIENLKGDALANAMMKAETKAKRRVTLSICGLGWLDETEIETIPHAQAVVVTETGEILDNHPITLDEARSMKTSKGNELGTLNNDQLATLVEKVPAGAPLHDAAQLLLDYYKQPVEQGTLV